MRKFALVSALCALAALTACNTLGDYIEGFQHMDPGNNSCTHILNTNGVPGAGFWSICNVPSSLAPPAKFYQPPPGDCGLLHCGQSLAEATTAARALLGRDDPSVFCLQRGDNILHVGRLPAGTVCPALEPKEPCKEPGETCDLDVECCEPAVCTPLQLSPPPLFDICCFEHGAACTKDEQCCKAQGASTGCIDGVCGCVPTGETCKIDECCLGSCVNGLCTDDLCQKEGETCDDTSDCCEGLHCSLNSCELDAPPKPPHAPKRRRHQVSR